jgi:hypothetical protein
MPTHDELIEIKNRAAAQLMKLPGVNAVGLGGRERAGRPTGEIVLKVFVYSKKPFTDIDPSELVPAEIEGVPTDVVEMGDLSLQVTPGRAVVPVDQIDSSRQRPLIGGCQLQVDLAGSGMGTLGCFLVDTNDAAKVYALTNHHVLSTSATQPTLNTTKAGQPTSSDSITKCCSAIIGKVAGGSNIPVRDAGIVRLDPGAQWIADIVEIGAVKGTHTVTIAEAATLTYQVRKRGMRTRLTGGTVQAINLTKVVAGVSHTNLTVISPNPDATLPAGTTVVFTDGGDSGSALVNDANEVVSLHFAGGVIDAKAVSVGTPIADVLSQFQAVEGLELSVATAANPGQVNTVPGAALIAVPPEVAVVPAPAPVPLAPVGAVSPVRPPVPVRVPVGGWMPGLAPPPATVLASLQRDLDRSERGRSLITSWLAHQAELINLLNTNTRVATAWHRSGAAALFQYIVRMMSEPALTVPVTINGRSPNDCLDHVHTVLDRYASSRLSEGLTQISAALPTLAGRTFPQVVAALGSR